ncbi:chaperonin GroEL [Lyticum sinuosum]|uniref:Chaperonin GroEL n=1 Tax=Lyticum sinuosum TaxID=1332059 RepID=A0AAE5AHL7_9RICK|nr:chaperonin GroEL [Lyticum sinuosum]MDZ5761283.1 60 kDa chaperonin [Lyticum sinuosum]
MSGKEIVSGNEARKQIMNGVNRLCSIVEVTLGPSGMCVALDSKFGQPKVTKDGVTVAKSVESKNRLENIGIQIVKAAASKANDTAGDGTTTATVLAGAMAAEGFKAVSSGVSPVDIAKGIDKGIKSAIEYIKSISRKASDSSDIVKVATISANGDQEIGNILASAFEKVGNDGVVTVEEAKGNEMELEVVEGMHFDRGYLSPYFVTNSEKMTVEMERPLILLVEKKISNIQDILPLLEGVVQSGRQLLIIAEDVDGDALATLVINKLRGGLKVAAVKAPGFGDRRKAMQEDIAILVGAQLVSEEVGRTLKNTTLEHLGTAQKVTISKDNTTIVVGNANTTKDAVAKRCAQIRHQIQESTSDYDKEKLEERLAKLAGGVAVVKVGGTTEVEVKEKKDRVDDAKNATRAAIEEGIVAGGGVTLLYASKALDSIKAANPAEEAGIRVVKKALRAPILRILTNAGIENSASIADKLLEKGDSNMLYDARKMQYVSANEGIIDPAKVVRVALESAGSVAISLLTTEGAIVDLPEEKHTPSMPGGGMGGMGGMGDMDF